MCAYQCLYKHLTHIFWNIDTLSNYLFFDLPSKTQKKNLKSFQFKKIAQKTLTKLQDCLDHRKFDALTSCQCVNCFESYESFNNAYSNLLHQIPKTSSTISKLKNERKNNKVEMIYLSRVGRLIQKIGQQFEKVFERDGENNDENEVNNLSSMLPIKDKIRYTFSHSKKNHQTTNISHSIMEKIKKNELPSSKEFEDQVNAYLKEIENLNQKSLEDDFIRLDLSGTPDNLKKDCATKNQNDNFKRYALAFLHDLMKHEIFKFNQINKFLLNVDRVDRLILEENEIGNDPEYSNST